MLAGYAHLLAAASRLRWDAETVALDHDAEAVARLTQIDRAQLIALVAGFWVAEHAVAEELAPYVAAAGELGTDPAARECFCVQAADEARHARFFDRVIGEVLHLEHPAAHAPPEIVALFTAELPATARTLARDVGVETMASAVGLYHLVLEGIVFAVGQEALHELAVRTGCSGVAEGVARVQGDERWHVGLGVLHLQRLDTEVDTHAAAARAIAAWGPEVATDERVTRVLAAHRRRAEIAGARALTRSATRVGVRT